MTEGKATKLQRLKECVLSVSNRRQQGCGRRASMEAFFACLKQGIRILLSVVAVGVLQINLSYAETVARNTIELQSTFKGNQEQPKVMYIVPWKKIKAPAAAYQPLDSLIGANFEYLDRDEFRRGIAYRSGVSESGDDNLREVKR